MTVLRGSVRRLAKEFEYRTHLGLRFFPRFAYNMNAAQLCYLCSCIQETRLIPGAIVEVGCSAGDTTVFLNNYMTAQGIEKEYVAVDTFSGFVDEDVDIEVSKRGKRRDWYTGFAINKKKWFDRTMEENGVARVRSVEADVNGFAFKSLGRLSFGLLDVDLYRPTITALPQLYEALSPGGILVVDDCDPVESPFDGAGQAYREFVDLEGIPAEIVHGKLGIVRGPLV